MADGMSIEIIHYADNRPILDLCLGKPLGIISLMDDDDESQSSELIGSFIAGIDFLQTITLCVFIKCYRKT